MCRAEFLVEKAFFDDRYALNFFPAKGQVGEELTMLLEGKSLKIIDLLEIEFMPICRTASKGYFVERWVHLCDSRIFLQKNLKDLS